VEAEEPGADRGLLYRLYERRLRGQIDPSALPHHIGVIVDGNRRWAKQRSLASAAHGHRAGALKIVEFLGWADESGIRVVTLYLLSADNLTGRETGELGELTEIIGDLTAALAAHDNWRIKHVGKVEGLPASLIERLDTAESDTAEATGLHINLAVGYGGRAEITDAVRSIVAAHRASGGTLDDLSETLTPELISDHLYTKGQPDPDLVIRTSGEQRVSDFMLWQSAHSEFYFVDALYPDLRKVDFLRALRSYSQRSRRFGS
jgi:short-chain Z-isoprenyl diphosphate synthase